MMKISNKILYLLLIMFFIINVNIVYLNSTNIKNELLKLKEKIIDNDIKIENMEMSTLYRINMDGIILNLDCEVVDHKKSTKKISDVLNGNKLILRYSQINCNTCVEEQLKILNTYKDSIGINNILLFADYRNINDLKKFYRINKTGIRVYKLDEQLNGIIKDIGVPYFFVFEKESNRIISTYIPQKNYSNITTLYLNSIKMKYFNK